MTMAQKSLLLSLRNRVKAKFDNAWFSKEKWAYRLGVIDALIDSDADINAYWFNNLMKYDK